MATAFFATSPPPPTGRIRTPRTPRLGSFRDNYEPYSPTRKSARVSSRRFRVEHTPEPQTPHHNTSTSLSTGASANSFTSAPFSPAVAKRYTSGKTYSMVGGRKVSGALDMDSTANAAEALGLTGTRKEVEIESAPSTVHRASAPNGMLPTPAKTPQKPPMNMEPGGAAMAMRNIFDDPMPSKKGRKKGLFGFEAEETAADISIYTDSQDRIPEIDNSADNPFYGNHAPAPEPTKRRSTRQKVCVQGEGEFNLADLEHRQDGYVAVFRGKKIFRKYDADHERMRQVFEDAPDPDLTEVLSSSSRATRSSVKKLLFPPPPSVFKDKATRSQLTEDEEEAVTDVEESLVTKSSGLAKEVTATPKSTKFVRMVSPPTTARATRSKKVDMDKDVDVGSDSDSPPRSLDRNKSGKATRSNNVDKLTDGSDSDSNPGGSGRRKSGKATRSNKVDKLTDDGGSDSNSGGSGRTKVSPFDMWQRTREVPSPKSPKMAKKRTGEPIRGRASKKLRGSHT